MPIYEYACAACGLEFEEWQKITAEPVRVCPKCQEPKVERLISRTAFQLKGGGWYSDLYSSSSKSSATDSKGGDAKTPASSGGSSSDSKSTESKSSDSGTSAGKKSDSSKKSESRAA